MVLVIPFSFWEKGKLPTVSLNYYVDKYYNGTGRPGCCMPSLVLVFAGQWNRDTF